MKLKLRYFFNFPFLLELFLYSFALFLSLSVALNMLRQQAVTEYAVQPTSGMSGWQFIIMFLVATAILLLILKYFKKPWLIQILFYLAIIEGVIFFNQAFFPWPGFLYITAFFLMMWGIYRNVLIHDFIVVVSASAIAAIFGFNFQPQTVIIILLFLATYDFWAVYKTKHMVEMFKGMVEAKVHFALIIPHDFHGLFKKTKEVSPSSSFMFLGTGDIVLPGFLVVSSLQVSQTASLCTIFGAICGFIFLYGLFITQEKRAPMPGLPPIVLGTLLGYLISFLI